MPTAWFWSNEVFIITLFCRRHVNSEDQFHKECSGVSGKYPDYTLRYPNKKYDAWQSTEGTDQPRKPYTKMPRIRPFGLDIDIDGGGKLGHLQRHYRMRDESGY